MRNRFPRLSIERLERRTLFAGDLGLGEVQLFAEPIEAPAADVPAEVAIISDTDVDAAPLQIDDMGSRFHSTLFPPPLSPLPDNRVISCLLGN